MVGLYLYINGIVCSGISEAETTNNKKLHWTFCIEAIQTQSICGLFATAEPLVYTVGLHFHHVINILKHDYGHNA